MTLRVRLLLAASCLLVGGLALIQSTPAQAPNPKAPKWAYAFDLACRKFGELDFTKDTKKWGVEVFKDTNNGLGVYICQNGNISVVSNFGDIMPPVKESKAPEWKAGLDLKARKAGEQEFTDKTKSYALEVFYDSNAGNWVYITENGNIATATGKVAGGATLEAPVWLYSYDLKCRKGGSKKFSPDTPQYGIEVYLDKNNGNLIYICQTGSIAISPGHADAKSGDKAPEWLHGQDLQVRKYGEQTFSKNTKKYGMEVFRDGNNGNLIFISEVGSIAVIPGPAELKAPTVDPKDAKFTHGLDLSARQAGEKDFRPDTKTYSMEIFNEPNVNATLYICQTGDIAVVASKK